MQQRVVFHKSFGVDGLQPNYREIIEPKHYKFVLRIIINFRVVACMHCFKEFSIGHVI